MSKRSQEGLSNVSSTVKTKSRSINLVSHRNLSIVRQNSQNTSDPKIPGSDRTDKLPSRYGKPLRCGTDESPSLRSQERSKGNTCKIGSEHPEQDVNPSSPWKPVRATWNRESSELPGQDESPSSYGKPVRGTQTQKSNSTLEFCNMKITNTEYMTKVFQNWQDKFGDIQDLPKFAIKASKTNMLM